MRSLFISCLLVLTFTPVAQSDGNPYYAPLEAENGTLTSPMIVMTDSRASNGQYVSAPGGSNGLAVYTVTVPATTSYVIWCRVLAKSKREDSFYVSVDGKDELVYEAANGIWSPAWRWTLINTLVKVRKSSRLETRKFALSAGTHTLAFRSREKNSKLDQLIVTDDLGFDPNVTPPPPPASPPQVSVGISPQSSVLSPGDRQAFTASVTGAADPSVTWSLSPDSGSISSSGIYTAPNAITVQHSVTVTATSVADNSISASAIVTLKPPPAVSISLSPNAATLRASEILALNATISGDPTSSVQWSLQPDLGSLSVSGLSAAYSAPGVINSNQSVDVIVGSISDPTKQARAAVSLLRTVTVSVSPDSVVLQPSDIQQLTATVSGVTDSGVTWQLDRPVGTLSSAGLYSAPASVAGQQTVYATATSVEDPTKSASSSLTIEPPVTVSLNPPGSTLFPGGSLQFAATVTGAVDPSVTWQVTPSVGTISANGLYSAPGSVFAEQTVLVIATSVENPAKSSSSPLTLRPVPAESLSLSLGPAIGTGGSSVSLPLVLDLFGGSAPAALQWTFEYSAANLTNVSVEVSQSAVFADKELICTSNATCTTCVAAGINANEIPPGIVALFHATLPPASSPSTRTVHVTSPLGASSSAHELSVAGHDATVTSVN